MTSEDRFWKWFIANEPRLFVFEADREAIFDELQKELAQIDCDLTFEFGPVQGSTREFVISAGGIQSAFPAVEGLYSKAPSLERWVWVKFRPRRLPIMDVEYRGKKVKAADTRYWLDKDGSKVGIVLFFEGCNKDNQEIYAAIGFLFLDQALGEYAVETQIGDIDFQSFKSKYFSKSSPLAELPADFDEYFQSQRH